MKEVVEKLFSQWPGEADEPQFDNLIKIILKHITLPI